MKLHKFAAALTAAALSLSLAAPALAAEAADQRLTRVTLAVKGTLGIGDEYTEFYGEPDETALGTRWNLDWKNEEAELNVTATDEGKVLSLNRWERGAKVEPVSAGSREGLSFPAMTRDQAGQCARAFLDRVLSENETVTFTDKEEESLSATEYSFRGNVELNGLPSPMSVYVRVRLSDGEVTRFWRGDVSDYAGAPGEATTSVTQEKARELLKSTLSLRLEYVRDGEEEMAVLRYLPNGTDEFYVDAATGELVNLTELRERLRRDYETGGGASNKFMASADVDATTSEAAPALTETELEGVAKLEDVLDKDSLDKKIKGWRELGLDSYTLGSASYSVDRETGEVTARISYAKNTEDGIYRRYVTVDAKTGELISMYGYNPSRIVLAEKDSKEYKVLLTTADAQAKGEAFLKKLWGGQFAKTERYNEADETAKVADVSFTFAQKVNGYFFPANSLSVRVDATDGSIMGFSRNFDDKVVFDTTDGLISEEQAVDAWCGSFPVELGYMEIPVALDMSKEFELLRNAGYSYYNSLKPGYALASQDAGYTGVDAKTGELVKPETAEPETMFYDDLEGHWAREILDELARYSVGWMGGKAQPDKALTQLDYILLLSSADGYRWRDVDEEDVERLYEFAYRNGILTKEERQEDKVLTRAELVKMFLNSRGYGEIALLPGIFRCGFADAGQIPEADLGYAALAQGLGLVEGDSQGNYASTRPAVRCEAAVMLWKYMKR